MQKNACTAEYGHDRVTGRMNIPKFRGDDKPPLAALLHWRDVVSADDAQIPALDDLPHADGEGERASALVARVKHLAIAAQPACVVTPATGMLLRDQLTGACCLLHAVLQPRLRG